MITGGQGGDGGELIYDLFGNRYFGGAPGGTGILVDNNSVATLVNTILHAGIGGNPGGANGLQYIVNPLSTLYFMTSSVKNWDMY